MFKKLMKKLIIIQQLMMLWCHFSTIASMEIPLGSILYTSSPGSTWSSSNTKFTLSLTPSPDSHSSFIASINHATVSVWQAGGASSVVDPGGHFCLHLSGDLRLVNSSGSTIWSSSTSGLGVTHAILQDSGEFVLKNGSVSVWSSFDSPTDTLVPSQILAVDAFLQSGIYSLNVTQFGDIVLSWNHSIEYWKLGSNFSNTSNLFSPYLSISALGILAISDKMLTSPLKVIFSADYGEGIDAVLHFLKLESDGNLRIYTSSKNGIITQQWAALSDQCLVFGYCGEMGICSYNASGPSCRCPSQNFIPVDLNDLRKGCKRKSKLEDCSESIEMVQLEHTKFLTFGHGIPSQIFFTASSACRLNCLTNPACVASSSLSNGSVLCYFKKPGFLSGYNSPTFPGTSFIKVCGAVVPNPNSTFSENTRRTNGKKVSIWILGVAVLCAVSGLLFLEFAVLCWLKNFRSYSASSTTPDALLQYASSSPVQFSYKELQKSTEGFREKLGEGVYKGTFGNKIIAVKKVEGFECGEKHFRVKVAKISSTHHLNLVKMIGFCSEGLHRIIVYEYMKNGSLAKYLFDPEEMSGKTSKWDFRFCIAIGAARGLSYLHESCQDCIVHCNFKPENILLDENYNAKVSDFSFDNLVNHDITWHYFAPELRANSPMSSKTDVYSFGMVLLEIVSGRRSSETVSDRKFWEWAYEEYEKGNAQGIVDKRLVRNEGLEMEQVMRVIGVGFWCIQEEPSARPRMGKVVQMLEGVVEILKPPAPMSDPSPSFSFPVVGSFREPVPKGIVKWCQIESVQKMC